MNRRPLRGLVLGCHARATRWRNERGTLPLVRRGALALTVLIVAGCSRKKASPGAPAITADPNAGSDTGVIAPSPSVALAALPSAACATPFPSSRLLELARDPKALDPWGTVVVDPKAKIANELPWDGKGGTPEKVAAAAGVPLPVAYADFLRRFDGADVTGKNGRIEVWSTKMATELATDEARPFRGDAQHRFLWIGTDGGDWELVIDIDDWFGQGSCAVIAADEASDRDWVVGTSFAEAVDRVVRGEEFLEAPPLERARPPK